MREEILLTAESLSLTSKYMFDYIESCSSVIQSKSKTWSSSSEVELDAQKLLLAVLLGATLLLTRSKEQLVRVRCIT